MLSDREIFFLNESNKIENLHDLSYGPNSNEGHAQAWLFFKDKSESHEFITLDGLCYAQKLLMEEQEKVGEIVPRFAHGVIRSPRNQLNVTVGGYFAPHYSQVPGLMDIYMLMLREELTNPTMCAVDIAARFHKKYESIHPFADGNGRSGRLIANFIMSYFELPIILFTYDDRKVYYEACKSEELMREYFRDKFREYATCVKRDNGVVKRMSKGIEADMYKCPRCNAEFALDWEPVFNSIQIYKGTTN